MKAARQMQRPRALLAVSQEQMLLLRPRLPQPLVPHLLLLKLPLPQLPPRLLLRTVVLRLVRLAQALSLA